MKKIFLFLVFPIACFTGISQQVITMEQIRSAIENNHPSLKMLDAEARSMDEAAKGAYSWMPPELGAGFFLTPYDPGRWKYMNGEPGMGMFMITGQQMFPNHKKQEADFAFMKSQSAVELQKKEAVLNELLYSARMNYYDWIVLLKKQQVLDEGERLLRFMIQSAEIRYKNGLGKISAYYKAKAALADIDSRKIMLQYELMQKKIAINTVMNRNTDEIFLVDTLVTWMEFSEDMFSDSIFRHTRSDLRVLDKSLQVNSLQQKAELASLKPQFGIRFDHMTGWGRQPLQFSVMGMVKLPMARWSSRMNKARAESLVWQHEAIRNQQAMIVNELSGQAGSELVQYGLKRKQLKLYEEQVLPALLKNFQTMQLAYEQNTEELFELFDAWQALNMTRMDYLDQMQDALRAQAGLMKILEIK